MRVPCPAPSLVEHDQEGEAALAAGAREAGPASEEASTFLPRVGALAQQF